MSEVSKLFDSRSKEYNQIYGESFSKKLLHQEKRVRAAIVEDMVLRYMPSNIEGVLIDVGCGMGNVILNLKEKGVKAKMYGIDISPEMINLANKKLDLTEYKDINFSTGTLKNIKEKADAVLSLGVIGYQERQEEFLAGLSNLVNNEGYLIFTTANGDSFLRQARRYLSKLHSLIKGKIKRKGVVFHSIKNKQVEDVLSNHGFRLEKRVYITFGLGLFASSIECSIDRFFLKCFSNSFIGKYLSLSVIYVYKRVNA